MNPEQPLVTERLVLEPLLPSHAAPLFPSLADPSLFTYIDQSPPESVATLEARFQLWAMRRSPDGSQAWLNWAARRRDEAGYVGWFQATVYPDGIADIAYLVFAAHQRRGFAREACKAIVRSLARDWGVTLIRATIDRRNAASIALAESLGFALAKRSGDELHYQRLLDL